MTAVEITALILGWIGNILVILLNFPQMIQTVKTKSTKDLNIWTYVLLSVVLISLFIYGILIRQYPIIFGNIISFIIMSPILILKATERRRESKMVDVNKTLKNVVKKGTVKIGEKQTKIAINTGTAKLIVMANNCPYDTELSTMAKEKKVPIYKYTSNGLELGYACGKNFAVSAFAVIDEGESSISQLVKKGK